MTDMMITHDGGGYDETEVTPEPYSLYRLSVAIEQNGLPLVATVLRQMAHAWNDDRAEITRLLELIRQTDAEKRAAETERDDARESIEYLKGEIEYWKREWAKDEMTIGSDMHRIQARAERDAALARAERLAAERYADEQKYADDLKKIGMALGDWQMVKGGFVEALCFHLRAMKSGIAQLVLQHVITMSRGAEITGLSLVQMRQWANSGMMARDAALSQPDAGDGEKEQDTQRSRRKPI